MAAEVVSAEYRLLVRNAANVVVVTGKNAGVTGKDAMNNVRRWRGGVGLRK